MQRTVKFHVKIPDVEIEHSQNPYAHDGIDEKAIWIFPFDQGNIKGTISLTLDPDAYSWDTLPDEDDEEIEFPDECDGIIVCVSGQSDNDFEPKEFLTIAHELTVEYMSKITTYLAVQLNQYWIHLGRMPDWDFWQFLRETKATWINTDNESSVFDEEDPWRLSGEKIQWNFSLVARLGGSDFDSFPATLLDARCWNGFYLYVSDERFSDLPKTLISSAKRFYQSGDYGMAAVQAVTALDVSVEPFVEQRCKSRNISGSKFKETKRFLAEYLKVLLPLVLLDNEISIWIGKKYPKSGVTSEMSKWTDESILEGCINLNSIRNTVAHRGKFEKTNIPKVNQGIKATELLLEFIKDNTEV